MLFIGGRGKTIVAKHYYNLNSRAARLRETKNTRIEKLVRKIHKTSSVDRFS